MILKIFLKKVKNRLIQLLTDLIAYLGILRQKMSHFEDDRIRVAFIVQMSEIWDKEKDVFEYMKNCEHFFAKLVVVPSYNISEKIIDTVYRDMYFFDNYKEMCIEAFDGNNWIDLEPYGFHYIFYQRPYNLYLPEKYRSTYISRYSKCCYIPYAYWPLKENICGWNKDFFRNVYLAFMESEENAICIRKRCLNRKGIVYCGYPVLEKSGNLKEPSDLSVLWTPRWSYDKNMGGSNFFKYMDSIPRLSEIFMGVKVIIRPHPLAFDNYVSTGLMTSAEVDAFKASLKLIDAKLDNNKIIENTFLDTKILISDISSVIFSFFLTGRPVILCDPNVEVSPAFKRIIEGIYVAHDFDEICDFIGKILSGEDPLKDKRKQIAEELANANKRATVRIVNHLYMDCQKQEWLNDYE